MIDAQISQHFEDGGSRPRIASSEQVRLHDQDALVDRTDCFGRTEVRSLRTVMAGPKISGGGGVDIGILSRSAYETFNSNVTVVTVELLMWLLTTGNRDEPGRS
ncbi:MAG: hypothetical protein KGR99_10445 [Betaproteobacteria bacterium]|nr:hypothetical protein [Betaproteobacteria bacterium]